MSYNIYLEDTDNVIGTWPSKELLPSTGQVIELKSNGTVTLYEVIRAEVGPLLVGGSAILGGVYVKPLK